jgi:hypothetical protein
MNWNSAELRRPIRLAICFAATPFLFLLCSGFLSGMVDAALGNGWIPQPFHRVAEFYCAPVGLISYRLVIGITVKASNYFGYDFVGGPNTTR